MRRFLMVFFLIAAAASSSAVQPPPRLRVLLPLYLEESLPGAHGSLWQSQFALYNGTARAYYIETCRPDGCLSDLRGDEHLLPNETQRGLPFRYPKPENGAAGTIIYLTPDPIGTLPHDADALSFQLRVMDLSRSTTNAGTEVPVVHESAFRTSTLRLLHVPVDSRFRLLFRLFEVNLEQAEFVVRVFDEANNILLSEHHIATSTPPQGNYHYRPGFGQISELGASAVDPQPAHVRVEVEPRTAGSAFWAYVSVTNNETQHVTLVTPQ